MAQAVRQKIMKQQHWVRP